MSDIGSYFNFKAPLSLAWHDCAGSLAKYLCVFPDKNNFRETIQNAIQQNLENDYSNNLKSLYKLLEPILSILDDGEYSLSFHNSEDKRLFKYKTSKDNFAKEHLSDYFIEITNHSKASDKNSKELDLDKSTYHYYEGNSISFVATESKSNIDLKRVEYFEEVLKSGKRPFAIIFTSEFFPNDGEADWISEKFIIDGHHKLIAYANLKIYPAIALITKTNKSKHEIKFDFQSLKQLLHPSQAEHLFKNWEEKEFYSNGTRIK
ncbi:MAG: hypothetical protein WBH03_10905 [Cyclobacteriaceae bacterium]